MTLQCIKYLGQWDFGVFSKVNGDVLAHIPGCKLRSGLNETYSLSWVILENLDPFRHDLICILPSWISVVITIAPSWKDLMSQLSAPSGLSQLLTAPSLKATPFSKATSSDCWGIKAQCGPYWWTVCPLTIQRIGWAFVILCHNLTFPYAQSAPVPPLYLPVRGFSSFCTQRSQPETVAGVVLEHRQ